MRRTLVFGLRVGPGGMIRAVCAACALTIITASAALASAPNNRGCLGESVAAAATAGGRDFGQLVALTGRTSTQGLGDEVQLVLAGEFPDDAFPNTCND